MNLVTLEQASAHLRRDTDADDADLTLKIHAASSSVLQYLKSAHYLWEPEFNTAGEVVLNTAGFPVPALNTSGGKTVRADIQNATLLLIGEFYSRRDPQNEGIVDPKFGYGYLPRSVVALLYPYRDPTVL